MSEFRFLDSQERGTIWKYIRWFIGILIVLSLVVFGLRWLFLPARILDPDEGLARWRWFYDTRTALEATTGNIQTSEKAIAGYEEFNGNPSGCDFQQRNQYARLLTVSDGYITHYNK